MPESQQLTESTELTLRQKSAEPATGLWIKARLSGRRAERDRCYTTGEMGEGEDGEEDVLASFSNAIPVWGYLRTHFAHGHFVIRGFKHQEC